MLETMIMKNVSEGAPAQAIDFRCYPETELIVALQNDLPWEVRSAESA